MCFNKCSVFILTCLIIIGSSVIGWASPIRIVSITDDFASIAKSVGGEHVHVQTLVKGSRNMHHINPKPSMVMKVKNADVLIRIGMSTDSWIDSLIEVARNHRVFSDQIGYIDASARISKLEVPTESIDGSMGDIHIEGNPHYWLDPTNGIIIAEQIRDHLITIDPSNSETYTNNALKFRSDIEQKMSGWVSQLDPIKDTPFITYHAVWPYFFNAFDLKGIAKIEPLPGIPPTAKHLRDLNQLAKNTSPKPIFVTANFYPKRIGDQMAKTVGSSSHHIPSNVGHGDISTYSELFDYIITEITN